MAALMTHKQFGYLFDLCRDAPLEEGEAILLAVKRIRGVKDSSGTVAYRNTTVAPPVEPLVAALSDTKWQAAKELAAKLGKTPQGIGKSLQKYITEGKVETRAVPISNTRMRLEYRLV